MRQLEIDNFDKIETDISDHIYAAMGSALHKVLEESPDNALRENELSCIVNGVNLVGHYDRMAIASHQGGVSGILQDWKQASIYEYIYGVKDEKIQQLNMYAYLARNNGYNISGLEIIFIYRDWSKRKARITKNYPKKQTEIIQIELWTSEKQEAFIIELIEKTSCKDICTPKDRWQTQNKYAVMREGRKSAIRVVDTEEEAQKIKVDQKQPEKCYVEERPGEDIRCIDYCQVNNFCKYYKEKYEK